MHEVTNPAPATAGNLSESVEELARAISSGDRLDLAQLLIGAHGSAAQAVERSKVDEAQSLLEAAIGALGCVRRELECDHESLHARDAASALQPVIAAIQAASDEFVGPSGGVEDQQDGASARLVEALDALDRALANGEPGSADEPLARARALVTCVVERSVADASQLKLEGAQALLRCVRRALDCDDASEHSATAAEAIGPVIATLRQAAEVLG